jgi:hypothetical protein
MVKKPAAAIGTHFFRAEAGVLFSIRFARFGLRPPRGLEIGARLLSE